MPTMSSASSPYTGNRDSPDWRIASIISPSSASAGSVTISVRWTITSLAVVLSNWNTFSMNSFSLLWMAPDSSPSSTMAMILSSDT